MEINIVTVDSGWILQKTAYRLQKEINKLTLEYTVNVSHKPKDEVVNIYMDIQNCYSGPTNGFDIGIFTHLHEDNIKTFQSNWLTLDRIVCMGARYEKDLGLVYPKRQISSCVLAEVPPWQISKTKVGIFQRGEHVGKGFHFMLRLPDEHTELLKEFRFLFVGSGWSEVVDKYSDLGIDCSLYDNEEYSLYEELYDNIDYLLVPSLWEGGPMSIVEACQKGKPIISSNVGFAIEDIPVDHVFTPGNVDQLIDIFDNIRVPVRIRRNRVAEISMQRFASHIDDIIKEQLCSV
jgi:glycosyltransferase involved in cell wall biosynthesis